VKENMFYAVGRSRAAETGREAGQAQHGSARPAPVQRSAALMAAGHASPDAVRTLQGSAGNAAVAASRAAVPVQRRSAYVATGSRESQTLAQSFQQRYGLSSDPSRVRPGEVLWIIGHGSEIGSGRQAAQEVLDAGFRPGHGREVRLVVCNAGRRRADMHAAPAQTIANILGTTVYGSTAVVWHVPGGGTDIVEGDFHRFAPQGEVEDITSRMGHLSVRDADPMDELTNSMAHMTVNANGWMGSGGYGMDLDEVDSLTRGMEHLSMRDEGSHRGRRRR
jgi:hypothetical protein